MHARHAPWTLAVGAAFAGAALAVRAFAQLPPPKADVSRAVLLEWNAPPECPAQSYVMAELARQLSGTTLTPEKRINARADVRRGEGQRWHLRLVTESGEQRGDRSLEAESCRAVADATALIVAMAVDPSRALGGDAGAPVGVLGAPPLGAAAAFAAGAALQPSPSGSAPALSVPPPATGAPSASAPAPPTPPPPAASAPTPPPPVSEGSVASSLVHFGASGSVFADDGVLSGISPGVGGALAWLPGRFRLEVSAAYFPPTRVQVATNPARGASFDLTTVGVRGCYTLVEGRFALGPCAGGEIGYLRGAGFGVVGAAEGGTVWEALAVGALGSLRVNGLFSFRLSLDVLAPLVRPSFVLAAPPRGSPLGVHKTAPVAGRFSFGGELHF